MKVKDLKALLNELPEGMTVEEADELFVMVVSDSGGKMIKLDLPDIECSGYSDANGEICDENGDLTGETMEDSPTMFVLFPVGVVTLESPCEESQVVEATLE